MKKQNGSVCESNRVISFIESAISLVRAEGSPHLFVTESLLTSTALCRVLQNQLPVEA
jgi:hypothetical protein